MPYQSHSDELAAFVETLADNTVGERENLVKRYLALFETLGAGVVNGGFDLRRIADIDGPRIIEIWNGYLKRND